MTKRFKPFRLINELELRKLEQDLSNNLQVWNTEFALFPLSLKLDCNPKPQAVAGGSVFVADNQAVALLPEQNLSVLMHCLVGDLSDCFADISNSLFLTLLQRLFGTGLIENCASVHDEWFYTGSPSLALTLRSGEYSLNIYLHPQWVLHALPRNEQPSIPKIPLQEAFDSQVLHCQVELHPLTLQLDKLLRLKPGDVIKTDQSLATPMLLKHQQQTICQATPGETNQSKSIQIVSLL